MKISGSWRNEIKLQAAGSKKSAEVVWREAPLIADADKQFHFNSFAMLLNYQSISMKDIIAPTDSRFRKD